MGQQQSLDRVFSLPRPRQQKLRPTTNHRHPVPQEFFQQSLDRQGPWLPSTSAKKISENVS